VGGNWAETVAGEVVSGDQFHRRAVAQKSIYLTPPDAIWSAGNGVILRGWSEYRQAVRVVSCVGLLTEWITRKLHWSSVDRNRVAISSHSIGHHGDDVTARSRLQPQRRRRRIFKIGGVYFAQIFTPFTSALDLQIRGPWPKQMWEIDLGRISPSLSAVQQIALYFCGVPTGH